MPKKTRQEKVLSAQRKKIKLLEQLIQTRSVDTVSPASPKNVSASPTPEKSEKILEKLPVDEKDLALKNFFIKDLKKSLLLIILIITLEIIIYSGTINNYFRL